MPDSLLKPTACKLCQTTFEPERIPILGEAPEARLQRFAQRLMMHVTEAHPNFMREVFVATTQYQAFLILRSFDHAEPELLESIESTRKFAHGVTKQKKPPAPSPEK